MRAGGMRGRMGDPGFGNLEEQARNRPFPKDTFKRVIRLYSDYKWTLAVVGLLVLVTSALGVVTPLLIQRVIDDALPQQDMNLLLWLIFGMIGAAAVSGVLNFIQSRLNAAVGFKVMEDMRRSVYDHLLKQPISFFSSTKTGDIQSRLANDVSSTQLVLTDTVVNILSSVTVVVSSVGRDADPVLGTDIVAVCTMPIFAYLSRVVGARRRRLTSQMQRTLADLTAKTGETLFVSGVIVAKTFGREAEQLREFQDTNTKLTDVSIRQYMTGRGFFIVVQAFLHHGTRLHLANRRHPHHRWKRPRDARGHRRLFNHSSPTSIPHGEPAATEESKSPDHSPCSSASLNTWTSNPQ